jgi:hypothetical protein
VTVSGHLEDAGVDESDWYVLAWNGPVHGLHICLILCIHAFFKGTS